MVLQPLPGTVCIRFLSFGPRYTERVCFSYLAPTILERDQKGADQVQRCQGPPLSKIDRRRGALRSMKLKSRRQSDGFSFLQLASQFYFFGIVPGTFGRRRYYISAGSQVRKCPVIDRANEGGLPPSA